MFGCMFLLLKLPLQGLDWYKANLKQDKDGDVADEFLLERTDQDTKGAHTGLQAGFAALLFYRIMAQDVV